MASSPVAQSETECPICRGTGWKTVVFPGKSSRVTRCDCRMAGRNERLFEQARVPQRFKQCTLSDFWTDFTGAHPSLASALHTAKCYVEQYPLDKTGLLFVGKYGIGKTHLAVGLLKALTEKGVTCLFYDYRELLKEIQNSYNPTVSATELGILRPVFDSEVLVLDELGAAVPTEWVWDSVQHILNTRYNSQLTTIITTNFPFQPAAKLDQDEDEKPDLFKRRPVGRRPTTLGDRIGDRMMSRLLEMCRIIQIDGDDFRKGPRNATRRFNP